MKVLILGEKGMLGNCVNKKFLSLESYEIITTNFRWPSKDFINFVKNGNFDWVINCIARIPQTEEDKQDYWSINVGLPLFLASMPSKLIQPSSDIDYLDGSPYGLSNKQRDILLSNFNNVYTIRCSIIGIEQVGNKSLLSKFLKTSDEYWVGYSNHMWNGITTLEWANCANKIIHNTETNKFISPYSTAISKYDLLIKFREIFNKNIAIIPTPTPTHFINENRNNGLFCGDINDLLIELKTFYNNEL